MKKILFITVLAICTTTVFAQRFSLSELIELSNKNWDEFDTYVVSRGFIYFNYSDMVKTYKYRYASDVETAPTITRAWYSNETKPNQVIFSTRNPDDYLYFKNQLKLLNFVYSDENGNDKFLGIYYEKGNMDVTLQTWRENKYAHSVIYTILLKTPNGAYGDASDQSNASFGNAQKTEYKISLEQINGVFNLNANIGGLIFNFILDSGAGESNISSDTESKLVSRGIIMQKDYLSDGLYHLADGSVTVSRRVNIPKITVGGKTVYNVIASIGPPGSPNLLGQTFLRQTDYWSIDNSEKVLTIR